MANGAAVLHPTYLADIRHFFTDGDRACMAGQGIDLGTYEGVKSQSKNICPTGLLQQPT